MDDWQPIETAPTAGPNVYVYFEGRENWQEVWACEHLAKEIDRKRQVAEGIQKPFPRHLEGDLPTHWRHLLPPPTK